MAESTLGNRGAAFIIGARFIPVGRVAVNMTAGALVDCVLRWLRPAGRDNLLRRDRVVRCAAVASHDHRLDERVRSVGGHRTFCGVPAIRLPTGRPQDASERLQQFPHRLEQIGWL